jgi:hypothetical protein
MRQSLPIQSFAMILWDLRVATAIPILSRNPFGCLLRIKVQSEMGSFRHFRVPENIRGQRSSLDDAGNHPW